MPIITLPDGSSRHYDQAVTPLALAADIGPGLARATVAAEVDGSLADATRPIERDATLRLITAKDADALEVIRHSTAHLLAQAVKRLFPEAQVTIGPVIKDGFYYDFSFHRPFTTDDLAAIEAEMKKIAKENLEVERTVMPRDDAVKFFREIGEEYKAKIIASIPANEEISLYRQGAFIDLCRGPHVPSTGRLGIFKLTKVAVGYEGKALAKNISGTVFRGRNIGIIGPNGSGKSTLLKTLLAQQALLAGKIQVGQKVELAYYDQQLSTLDPEATALEEMRGISPLATDETLRGYLARFLFFGDDVFHKTASLSGGEKSRLALAKLIFGKSNTLLLDEPTNHLDIPSCEALEEALQDFPGTVIMVSHDRYLLNKLADQILYLDGEGSCTWFDGTYEEFAISQEAPKDLQPTTKPVSPTPRETPVAPEKPSSNGQKFSKNELAKLKHRCEFLEQEIQRIEGLIETNTSQLSDPDVARDFVQFKQLTNRHEDLSAQLSRLYQEWEKSLKLLESA